MIGPLHQAIIDALAELAADEYLTAQATEQAEAAGDEAERVLPRYDHAA